MQISHLHSAHVSTFFTLGYFLFLLSSQWFIYFDPMIASYNKTNLSTAASII
jgi:hypothetical protein